MKDTTVGDAWAKMRKDIGIKPEDNARYDAYYAEYEKDVCRGFKDIDTIIPFLEKEFSLVFPNGYSIFTDFVNRFALNESIIPVVTAVDKKMPVGLLTNMYPRMLDEINKRHLIPEFNWEFIVDSSVVHAMKPDKEIYEIAQKRIGVSADQILFIDNSKKNIDGARAAGWQAYWYDPADCEKSSKLLEEYMQNLNTV